MLRNRIIHPNTGLLTPEISKKLRAYERRLEQEYQARAAATSPLQIIQNEATPDRQIPPSNTRKRRARDDIDSPTKRTANGNIPLRQALLRLRTAANAQQQTEVHESSDSESEVSEEKSDPETAISYGDDSSASESESGNPRSKAQGTSTA